LVCAFFFFYCLLVYLFCAKMKSRVESSRFFPSQESKSHWNPNHNRATLEVRDLHQRECHPLHKSLNHLLFVFLEAPATTLAFATFLPPPVGVTRSKGRGGGVTSFHRLTVSVSVEKKGSLLCDASQDSGRHPTGSHTGLTKWPQSGFKLPRDDKHLSLSDEMCV